MRIIYVLLTISILMTGCQSSTETQSSREDTSVRSEKSIAYKLAALENGGQTSENDQLVRRFDNLLQQLDTKYELTQQQIGDMTYKLRELGEERGINISMVQAMEGATQVNLSYTEYLGSYLTLREKGYTHENTIESLRLLK